MLDQFQYPLGDGDNMAYIHNKISLSYRVMSPISDTFHGTFMCYVK